MTMELIGRFTGTRAEYEAMCDARDTRAAALAASLGADAIGREMPREVCRHDGYRYMRAGTWYLVVDGDRVAATSARSRQLRSLGYDGVGHVGPIARAEGDKGKSGDKGDGGGGGGAA